MTRRPPEKLSPLRQLQKQFLEAASTAGDFAEAALGKVTSTLSDIDNQLDITERTKKLGTDIAAAADRLDARFDIATKAKYGYEVVGGAVSVAAHKAAEVSDDIGLTSVVESYVVSPAKSAVGHVADLVSTNETVRDTAILVRQAYGSTRSTIKPYFQVTNSHELLRKTKTELAYISACILQISPTESSTLASQFSRALTAKLAGAGSTAALLALVSSLGSASTGTAIATLSGAAATKASLAWVGGMVGGGMAAGAFLTSGVTVVVGLAAYKALASERRSFESLTPLEQRLVESCWMLIAVCDSYLEKEASLFHTRDAKFLLDESFKPLYAELTANIEVLCVALDVKNALALRAHALHDFQGEVLDGWDGWLALTGAVGLSNRIEAGGPAVEDLIGGAFYGLMSRHPLDDSVESHLMLEALRRSRSDLSDASEHDLGEYLRSLSPDQLKHAAENVKGIYHELAWAEHYNATHSGSYAEVFGSTNHLGSDVLIRNSITHEPLSEIQLKAVNSSGHVYEHIHRYPHIPVAATDEVAGSMADAGVMRSGFSNETLRATTHDDLDAIHDHTVINRAEHAALLALGVGSTRDFIAMLQGKKAFPEAVINTASTVGTVAATTAVTAFLFS